MLDMIRQRKEAEKKEERYDLFSSLLDASEAGSDGQAKLTDQELLGEAQPTRTPMPQSFIESIS